jgi:hypothetical protein
MTIDGFNRVFKRFKAGLLLALASLDYLQLTRRGIVIELSRTVNYSSLEARVSVAERYRGYYYSRVVCDKVLVAAKCVNVVRYSLTAIAKIPLIRLDGAFKTLARGLSLRFRPLSIINKIKMTDPFNIIASVVGVIILALHATRLLLVC